MSTLSTAGSRLARSEGSQTGSRMPAVFLGHGNPMNAIQQNSYTETWRRLGEELPRPRGVVCISAHWYMLREDNVLIVGSGNLVHNLHTYAWGRHVQEPYDWAIRFEEQAKAWMQAREHAPLIGYETLGRDALLAAPTPEHYLPLLYVLGVQRADESVTFLAEGVDGGSVSMLSLRVG